MCCIKPTGTLEVYTKTHSKAPHIFLTGKTQSIDQHYESKDSHSYNNDIWVSQSFHCYFDSVDGVGSRKICSVSIS